MSDTTSVSGANPSGAGGTPISGEGLHRYRLARAVVVGTFLAIFALVFALLVIAQHGSTAVQGVADKTFNIVLPVLAAWMSTVLAFYFSAQTQERTIASLDRLISQAAGTTTPATTVAPPVSIAFGSIKSLFDLAKQAPAEILLKELQTRFQGTDAVSRLVFHRGGVFCYVLHVATLNKYLVKHPPPPDQTFADLLKDDESVRAISKLVAFVKASATLAEAKTALEAVPGAQDVIVTDTGDPTRPMVGWLTNVDLVKKLTAGS